MANKILAPIFNWFRDSLFTPSGLQESVQPASQFDDGRTRAAFKKCGGPQASGKKRKAIQRGYPPDK